MTDSQPQWEVRMSSSRQLPYFYDPISSSSTWDIPPGLTEAQALGLPGAHLLEPRAQNGAATDKVRASHLLVKHRESRKTSSWKEKVITRSKEEAEAIIRQHMQTLGPSPTPQAFAELASVHSDCSSAKAGGDLGVFGRGQMQRPFEEATYALPVGALSGIVQTDSGTHIILRTA